MTPAGHVYTPPGWPGHYAARYWLEPAKRDRYGGVMGAGVGPIRQTRAEAKADLAAALERLAFGEGVAGAQGRLVV